MLLYQLFVVILSMFYSGMDSGSGYIPPPLARSTPWIDRWRYLTRPLTPVPEDPAVVFRRQEIADYNHQVWR